MEAHNRILSLFNEACNAVSNDDACVIVCWAVFLRCTYHKGYTKYILLPFSFCTCF